MTGRLSKCGKNPSCSPGSPQPVTPTAHACTPCSLLPAGCRPATPGAVLGSLCTPGARTCTRGLAGPQGAQLCPAPQPLPRAASVTLQGGHRPGPRIRAGHGGTPRLSAGRGAQAPRPARVPCLGPGRGSGWPLVLGPEAGVRPSAHGGGRGAAPAHDRAAWPHVRRPPGRSWRGEGPARSCSGGGQV